MKKEYKLLVDSLKHKDIYDYLEGLKKPTRAEMIRAAIRLMIFTQGSRNINTEHEKALPGPPPLLRKGHEFG